MSDRRDREEDIELLDPTGGPDEPTPEFTPTPEAEEIANWVAGIDDERTDEVERAGVASGERVYGRPPPEILDTPSGLCAWCEQFIDAIFGSVEDGAPGED